MLSTRAGWIDSIEVTEVIYDPKLTNFEELAIWAQARDCAQPIVARNEKQLAIAKSIEGLKVLRSDQAIRDVKDDKYYLGTTDLRFVPLTQTQRTRINADVKNAEAWLSPRQAALLRLIKSEPKAGWQVAQGQDLRADWQAAEKVMGALIAEQKR